MSSINLPRSPLDPALASWLKYANEQAAAQPDSPPNAQEQRELLATLTAALCGEGPQLAHVANARVPIAASQLAGRQMPATSVPVRLYDATPQQSRQVLVYLHGGGHCSGSLQVYEPILHRLCTATGQLVVGVEYRLAPEHPYPAGLHDCLGVVQAIVPWLRSQGRNVADGITLAGDSAGGALAASISAMARDGSCKALIQKQVLIYPSLDYTMSQPSLNALAHGYLLDKDRIDAYFEWYMPPDPQLRKNASPVHMGYEGLPPTLLVTAGYCPLQDEGLVYLQGLKQAGITYWHLHVPDVTHAFLNLHTLVPQQCERIYQAIADFVQPDWKPSPPQ